MNLHINLRSLFGRQRDETAELRDRALIAETQVLLLRDIVEHLPRKPVREVRRDAGPYRDEAAKRRAELVAYAAKARAMRGKVS